MSRSLTYDGILPGTVLRCELVHPSTPAAMDSGQAHSRSTQGFQHLVEYSRICYKEARRIRLVGGQMSTPGRCQWLKSLFSLILLIGLSTPAPAEDDGIPDMSVVELYFWLCLQDNEATITENGAECCDGAACYICFRDFSECWIKSDTSSDSSAPQRSEREALGLNIKAMQDRPSEGQLQGICSSVKANFTKLKGFGYSCVKSNCNGKGDYCSIVCHGDRRCTAGTPDVIRGAVSLRGILQNGDNIDRSDPGSESSGGGGGGNEDEGSPCGPDGCLY